MNAERKTWDCDEARQRAGWGRTLAAARALGRTAGDVAEPSPGFAARVMLAVDDGAEARQRAEWRALAARAGLASASAVRPSPDFAKRAVEAALRGGSAPRRLSFPAGSWRRLRGRAAAAAALFAAALLLPELAMRRTTPPAALARTGPYSDRPAAQAAAWAKADDAVDWLVSRQRPDGAWASAAGGSEVFQPALTALAMMAIERHAPERHREAIDRAAAALAAMQGADGSFGGGPSARLYNHAFATYALISHALLRNEGVTPAIERAVGFALASQNESGAWDYAMEGEGNAALSLWELGILAEARELGLEDFRGGLRRGLAWLKRRGGEGLLDYRETLDRHGSSSGGIVLTQLATDSIVGESLRYPELEAVAGNLRASVDAAYGRYAIRRLGEPDAAGDFLCTTFRKDDADLYPAVIVLLGVARK